jgi:hypothetical protein
MGQGQNPTTPANQTEADVVPVPFEMLKPAQQAWVDYNVVQGTIIEPDGSMRKLSVREFADQVGVNRTTCYEWTKTIPFFWDMVADRRKVIFAGARTAKVWNAVFLSATVKLNPTAQAMWLSNADPAFKMPNQTVTHEAGGGLMDVLEISRQRKLQNAKTIEAEVIDAANPQAQQ